MAYTKHMSVEEIRDRARSGPIYLLSRRGFAAIIGIISTITIARLLTPEDFGLAAMATVTLAFVQVFRDFGLTNAILRKGYVEEYEINFLFWFNLAATFAIALLIAGLAPFIASFFGEPRVRDIILVALIGFLIGGASLQHNALLKRDLRFRSVAAVETFSVLAGFLVGLAVALIRRDYWAIVAGTIAQSFTSSLLNISLTRWRPSRPRMIPDVKDLFQFGLNSTTYTVLNFTSRYASTVIIGHWLGSVSLGYFNRAFTLYQIPLNNLLQPIAHATLPVLARLRPHPELYRVTYLGMVERLSSILMPAAVVLAFIGIPLVRLLLGESWTIAGQTLSVLAPALAIYGVIWPISDLMVTQNRAGELRTTGLFDLGLRLSGTLIGVRYGLLGAAAGYTVATLAMMPVRTYWAGRKGPVTIADQWKAMVPALPLMVGALAGCTGAHLLLSAAGARDLVWVLVAAVFGGCGALIGALPFRMSRAAITNVVTTLTGRHRVAEAG